MRAIQKRHQMTGPYVLIDAIKAVKNNISKPPWFLKGKSVQEHFGECCRRIQDTAENQPGTHLLHLPSVLVKVDIPSANGGSDQCK